MFHKDILPSIVTVILLIASPKENKQIQDGTPCTVAGHALRRTKSETHNFTKCRTVRNSRGMDVAIYKPLKAENWPTVEEVMEMKKTSTTVYFIQLPSSDRIHLLSPLSRTSASFVQINLVQGPHFSGPCWQYFF